MSITVIGDVHLEKLGHIIPNFNDLVILTLKRTLDDALDRGATHVVFVGDIFDNAYPSQAAQVAFLDLLTDYPDLQVLIIPGNHDFADIDTDSLRITRWAKKLKANIRVIAKPTLIKIDGLRYYFMPHPFVQDMPSKADLGFAHFAANGARGDNGFTVRTKHQPKGKWILGDFHGAQVGKVKRCYYEYVGSLTQLSFEEKAKKSVISIEDGEKVRRRVDLAYKLRKYTLSSDEELADCTFGEENTYYSIKTKNGYVLPKGWALEHPEVVRQGASSAKRDPRAAMLVANEIVHPLSQLLPYLLNAKVKPERAERAVELANSLKIRESA